MGTPNKDQYPDGIKLAQNMRFKFPQYVPMKFEQLMPTASQVHTPNPRP